MNVSKDKVISLTYELRAENNTGKVIEIVKEDNPLNFIFGAGYLLPKFESNLDGLKKGDSFEFTLKSADAYGEYDETAIIEVPKNVFMVDGKIEDSILKIGNNIPMQDNQGNRLNGKVLEINDTAVRMDFNHPLAGTNLFFTGNVFDIREATADELSQGLHHSCCESEGDCQDGGCDCGCH